MADELNVVPEVDGMLAAYVRAVESLEDSDLPENEKTLSIILTLGGMVVAGQLISFQTFYRESLQDAEEGSDGPETGRETDSEAVETVERVEDDKRRDFIHLRGAKFYAPNISSDGDGVYWRGKLSAVSGFALGSLQKPERKIRTMNIGGVKIEI